MSEESEPPPSVLHEPSLEADNAGPGAAAAQERTQERSSLSSVQVELVPEDAPIIPRILTSRDSSNSKRGSVNMNPGSRLRHSSMDMDTSRHSSGDQQKLTGIVMRPESQHQQYVAKNTSYNARTNIHAGLRRSSKSRSLSLGLSGKKIQSRNTRGSNAGRTDELLHSVRRSDATFLRGWVINPDSKALKNWFLLQCVLILYTAISVPFELGFLSSGHDFDWLDWLTVVIDICIDMFFIIDIFVNFRTGFHSDGKLVAEIAAISERYIYSYFPIDFIASIPLLIDLGQLLWHLPSYLLLPKLLRLLRVVKFISDAESRPGARSTNNSFFRLMKLVGYALMMSHFLACARQAIAMYYGFGMDEWLPKLEIQSRTKWYQYLHSLFWSLGLMTGLRDASWPATKLASSFTLVVILMGVFLFAIVVGNLGEVVEQEGARVRALQARIDKMSSFIRHYNVPKHLGSDILDFYNYSWQNSRGYDPDEIRSVIPECLGLSTDVSVFLVLHLMLKVDIFRSAPDVVLAELAKRLVMMIAAPGESIVKQGDHPSSFMCFIGQGTIKVLVNSVHVTSLHSGSHFGEPALFENEPRSASCVSENFSELWVLSRQQFEEVMAAYPNESASMKSIVWKKKEEAKARDKIAMKWHKSKAISEDDGSSGSLSTSKPSLPALSQALGSGRKKSMFVKATSAIRRPSVDWKEVVLDLLPKRIVQGGSWHSKIVSFLVKAVLVYNMFTVPVRIGFKFYSPIPVWVMIPDLTGDLILWYAISLRFRTTFMEFGVTITDLKRIRGQYLRSWFLLDIAMLFPINLLSISTPLLRVPRLLGVFRFYMADRNGITQRFESVSAFTRIIKSLFTFGLLMHIVSCVYWAHTFSEGFGEFPDDFLPIETFADSDIFDKYTRASLFALKVLTGRGNPLAPESEAQLIFTIISTILGLFGVGYVIGQISLLSIHLNPLQSQHRQRVLNAQRFMEYREFPDALQQRVTRYLNYRWEREKGISISEAIADLPKLIAVRVREHLALHHLHQVPMFAEAPTSVIHALLQRIHFVIIPANEYVYHRGQIGEDMFIVAEGIVSMKSDDGSHRVEFGPGSFFGEEAILDSSGLRASTVLSTTSCTLIAFSADALEQALQVRDVTAESMLLDTIADSSKPTTKIAHRQKEEAHEIVQMMIDLEFYWFPANGNFSSNMHTGDQISNWLIERRKLKMAEALKLSNLLLTMDFLVKHGHAGVGNGGQAGGTNEVSAAQLYRLMIPRDAQAGGADINNDLDGNGSGGGAVGARNAADGDTVSDLDSEQHPQHSESADQQNSRRVSRQMSYNFIKKK